MGYRSDVAYMIQFHKQDDYWGFVAEAKCDPDTAMCFTDEGFKQNDKKLSVHFGADQVKWYPDYVDVQCHILLWDKARDREDSSHGVCDGYFARIGEEADDITELSFGDEPPYDYINIERALRINWEINDVA
jgi:hypothetical protein